MKADHETSHLWTPSAPDILRTFYAVYSHLPAVRDAGLLQSAVERPSVTLYGQAQYTTLHRKAAALMDSLCRNHPLIDGNKRCAWIAVRLAYFRNRGLVWTLGDDSAYDLVVQASDSHLDVDVLAERLEEGFHPRDQR